MKWSPIPFKGPMVEAILEGRKTQTRRIVKPQPIDTGLTGRTGSREAILLGYPGDQDENHPDARYGAWQTGGWLAWSRYGGPGDWLWVKETWAKTRVHQAGQEWVVYRAGDNRTDYGGPWKPSMFLRRQDSRIHLQVKSIRIERLQDISERDAAEEGVGALVSPAREGNPDQYRATYRDLWELINGHGSWAADPWVWVIEWPPYLRRA